MSYFDQHDDRLDEEPMEQDAGQAAVSLVLMLGTFLFAVFGFAVDLTNVWFHRQTAVAAADAACQAGAMDMLSLAGGLTPPAAGFTVGTASNCVSSSGATMCAYAKDNGYDGAGLNANRPSNAVSWSFPATVAGVTGSGTHPFLQVSIAENVKTYFIQMLQPTHYLTINVATTCGLAQVAEAAPMVVLHPTLSGAFTYSGGGALNIVGGPSRGLQVNSTSTTAINWSASGVIDLSAGGPKQTGSDAAVVGGPATAPTNGSSNGYKGGSTGSWRANVLPVADPFASVSVPASVRSLSPGGGTSGTWVAQNVDGCQESSTATGVAGHQCLEYSPGYYPSGIDLTQGAAEYMTAIFKPGIYYMNGSLTSAGSTNMRVAKPSGYAQTDGVMFYFYSGSLNYSGCSGCQRSTLANVNSTDLTCDGSAPAAGLGMPTTIGGNVLYGQCTKNGTYWDTGPDTTDSRGSPGSRGLLVFQDHANTTQPQFTGSGQLTFSGALYFHSTSYSDVLNLSGGASSGTYVLGEIVTDQVNLSGSGIIKLALNPAATTNMAKVSVFQ